MSLAVMYEHKNFGGGNVTLVGNPSDRYVIGTFPNLFRRFNDVVSSVRLFDLSGWPKVNNFFLFEHAGFVGRFDALYYDSNRDYPFYHNFNDLASSSLIVQHHPNLDLVYSMQYICNKFGFITSITNALTTLPIPSNIHTIFQGVLLNGSPKFQFTIDKPGYFGQDLIRIEIPLRFVLMDPLKDQNVYLLLYLKLSAINGRLHGDIVDFDITNLGFYAVLRGVIREAVNGSISRITEELNRVLGVFTAEGVYTMPWSPNNALPSLNIKTDYLGSTTNEDVAIIIY